MLACAAGVLAMLAAPQSSADEWPSPQIREVFSESREYFVRIVPGQSLGDTVGFGGAKKGKHATAELYRRADNRSYRIVAETSLLNPIAPVDVLLANSGHMITLDNWHNVGYGRVVVAYDSAGKLLRSYELRDLFEPEEIARFPHSVSSIHWRKGPAYVRPDQTTALITVKPGVDFLFGLDSGEFKYCEPHGATYRCRSSNPPGQWTPGHQVPVLR